MTQRQISDKKSAIPVFDIRSRADNTVYGSGTKTNELSFPLSKVTEDLKRELDLHFSHDNNAVRKKNLIPKKDNNNANEIQQH